MDSLMKEKVDNDRKERNEFLNKIIDIEESKEEV